MSFIYQYETSTLTPFVKPCNILNLAIQNICYVQSFMESAFLYNPRSTNITSALAAVMNNQLTNKLVKLLSYTTRTQPNWSFVPLVVVPYRPSSRQQPFLRQHCRYFNHDTFLKKGQPWPLFHLFLSFQTNITILTTNKCEKCPSSIRRRDSNSQPFDYKSPHLTTRPLTLYASAIPQVV